MSRAWITETQVAGAAGVIVVHVLKKMGVDLDPAFLSIAISCGTYALTLLLRVLQKNAERLSDLAVSYSDGSKTEEMVARLCSRPIKAEETLPKRREGLGPNLMWAFLMKPTKLWGIGIVYFATSCTIRISKSENGCL